MYPWIGRTKKAKRAGIKIYIYEKGGELPILSGIPQGLKILINSRRRMIA